MIEQAAGENEDDARRDLRGVAGQIAGGVALVTTIAEGGEPHATTASAFLTVSSDPPLVAVFFANATRMHAFLRESGSFSVSVLRRGQHEIARRFARPGRPTGWIALSGLSIVHRDPRPPILADALAWLDCSVVQLVPMGDHGCFVAEVLAFDRVPEGEPLLYYRGRFHTLGGPAAPASWAPLERSDLAAEW